MAKKKNQQRNVIIGILLVVALLLLLNSSNSLFSLNQGDDIQVTLVHKSFPLGYKPINPFVITPQGSSIKQGDSQTFTAANEIDASCANMDIVFTWKKGSSIKGSETFNAGYFNPQTSVEQYTVKTSSSSSIGDYVIETQYRCDGVLLKRETSSPNSFFIRGGTGTDKDTISFKVYGEDDTTPPPPQLHGQILCWVYNVNNCESIYQSNANTCAEFGRYDSEIACKNANLPLDTICEKDGGTKVCPDNPIGGIDPLLIVGGLLVVGGIYLNFIKKRNGQ